ncbi:MAG: Asp23/Gls24 family envelope stress response protein [Lachnospiraceae bacterium]|nr:Asp23/Gls24 family envelope stress response protein [Lachnospiraceae bacterium]MBR6638163.1 Asp23/Gls24 family envelope stress response protein [Lachnospiraceae bacterium]
MSEQNLRDNEQIYETKIGEVQIADEVVTIIAGLAATEVEGVVSLAGNITNDKVSKKGIKNLAKGVKVDVLQGSVSVEVSMLMKYGYSIPGVTQKVQDKVKTAIENMTGLQVTDVNVRVVGVEIEKSN